MAKLLKHIFSQYLSKSSHPLTNHDHHETTNNYDDDHNYNNGSFPTVPVFILAETVKKQLPLISYTNFIERTNISINNNNNNNNNNRANVEESYNYCSCIVCLSQIEPSHEVRVPFNCCHVFHRECLDGWVDQGQVTCPLCRSKLLPMENQDHHDDHDHHQVDPWRSERMVYLFGEDCLFGHDD